MDLVFLIIPFGNLAVAVFCLSGLLLSCAPKPAGRYTICQAMTLACSSGDCAPEAFKDVNTGQFVNANQCDEVRP